MGRKFPILIKGAEENPAPFGNIESLYLSDAYAKSPMETFVLRFVQDAKFISDSYLTDNISDSEKSRWTDLFSMCGVQTDIKDIVFSDVIPNLNQYQEIDIVLFLAKYHEDIKRKLNKGDKKILEQIAKLKLRCEDGIFRRVNETLVAGKYFDYTPQTLPEVVIPNMVVTDYLTQCGEERELRRCVAIFMRLLADVFVVGLDSATRLSNTKVSYFLKHQDAYKYGEEHYNIISYLARFYDEDNEGLKELLGESQAAIKLYSLSGAFKAASSLTMHSVYNPECDFYGYGIRTQREFVSPTYCEHTTEHIGRFFRFLNVHHRFGERDLELLRVDEFSRYFWQEYAPSRKENLAELCTEEKLKNICCIPTASGVKRPREVYDSRNSQLEKIVRLLPDGNDSLPSVYFPIWLGYIGLQGHLNFKDCLAYLNLNIPKHDYRRDIYRWMVAAPDDVIRNNKASIQRLRETLLWFNGQKQWVPLKGLYALEWSEKESTLKDNFSKNRGICNPSYMPEYKTDYDRLCKILDIKILTDEDFEKLKDKNAIRDEKAIREFKKRLLYLAYKNDDNWRNKYAEYCEQLDKADISKCNDIRYSFNEEISTDILIYDDTPSALWYVGEWDGKRFSRVVEWITKTFRLSQDKGYMEKLFEYSFSQFVAKEENGCVPQELLDFLSEEDKKGLRVEEIEEVEEFNEDYDSQVVIAESEDVGIDPHIAAPTALVNGYWRGDSIVGEHARVANHEQWQASGNATLHQQNSNQISVDASDSASTESHIANTDSRRTRSDKGSTHDYPQSRQRNNSPSNDALGSSNESVSTQTETARPSLQDRLAEKWDRKKNEHVGKPAPAVSGEKFEPMREKPSVNEKPDEPFFNPNTNNGNLYSREDGNGYERTAANIKRRNTEARQKAETADDEMTLYDMFIQTPKYSYLWFKYLIELKFGDRGKIVPRTIQLDFVGFDLSENNQIVEIYNPNKAVPRWLEHADKVSVHVIGKTSTNLPASIIKVDTNKSSVDIMIDARDASKLEKSEKIRIDATYSTNIIDSLTTRFLQLDFEDEFSMEQQLPTNIEFIYGPPGTGKTTRLVERLSSLITDSEEGTNILVLTPTNKAADVIATKLADDEVCYDFLTRFGATESRYLIEDAAVVQTRDTLDMTLLGKNIVVTTAARYAYDYIQPDDTSICDFDWEYIVIDEASMMDLVTIVYILFKGHPTKFIIAGDPKQISPVKENNIEESVLNIYDMVGLNSFRTAIRQYKRYPIEALTMQYRSIPIIGKLVSDFAYNGLLQPYPERAPQKALQLDGLAIKDINFIGFKTEEFDMLYGLTSVGDSAFHLYSAIFTYNFVDYIAQQVKKKYPNSQYTVGIVCPYRAQADAIQQMLDNRPLDNEVCKISSGTVHKFQGDECDIMIVVLNPPLNCTSGSHINNENIINVAMSRARDYLFFIMPDRSMEKFHMRDRLGGLVDTLERKVMHCSDIEKTILGSANFIGDNTCVTCHLPVNVYYDSRALYEVRIDDTTLDIQINDYNVNQF